MYMRRTALRFARLLTFSCPSSSVPRPADPPHASRLSRLYSAQPRAAEAGEDASPSSSSADFDSNDFRLPFATPTDIAKKPTWEEKYRERADKVLFHGSKVRGKGEADEDSLERSKRLGKALLEAAFMKPDDLEEDEVIEGGVPVDEQRSLLVGIVGAPNAGKSSLTNSMLGKKVTAVSRKTNTTTHEVLGVRTEGNTQICIFDTPGITLGIQGHPQKTDVRARVQSAWKSVDLYDLLIVIFDVHRHLTVRRDPRVLKLINYLGSKAHPTQKRVLCLNKIDLVEDKKDLLMVIDEFKDLPGFDRFFMISGLKGSGVKDLVMYLNEQAIKRPWEEEPTIMSEETMKSISLEVVREKMLNHIHQEIPYVLEHRLLDWKELRDGSLRIEQHFIAPKQSQRQILVGKNGSKIGRIGIEANEELRSIFKREVHLILLVRVARKHGA